MKNLNDEIKLTIELMQGDIDEGAHNELQYHLMSLLEMKRDLLGECAHTGIADQIQVWPVDADEKRMDVVGKNSNDGAHCWQINSGATPPVSSDTIVMVEYRNGERDTDEARLYGWSLEYDDSDIIRWRLA